MESAPAEKLRKPNISLIYYVNESECLITVSKHEKAMNLEIASQTKQ